MIGDCDGPVIVQDTEAKRLNGLAASYTNSGVGSLVLRYSDRTTSPIGRTSEFSEQGVERTSWALSEAQVLVGLEVYYTSEAIRSLSVITLD